MLCDFADAVASLAEARLGATSMNRTTSASEGLNIRFSPSNALLFISRTIGPDDGFLERCPRLNPAKRLTCERAPHFCVGKFGSCLDLFEERCVRLAAQPVEVAFALGQAVQINTVLVQQIEAMDTSSPSSG